MQHRPPSSSYGYELYNRAPHQPKQYVRFEDTMDNEIHRLDCEIQDLRDHQRRVVGGTPLGKVI